MLAFQSVRLACVKHAASVRPEPGSNSPINILKNLNGSQNYPCNGISDFVRTNLVFII